MKVAMWTPFPPEATGIADYSFELSAALATRLELTVVVRDDGVDRGIAPPGVTVVGAGARRDHGSSGWDVDIYQMGNDARLPWIYDRALVAPGVVVLHESLLDFIAVQRSGGPDFVEEALWSEGLALGPPDAVTGQPRGLPTIRAAGVEEADRLAAFFARRLAEASRAMIVHDEWLAGELRRRHPGSRVHVVHHGASVLADERARGRMRAGLGWDESNFVFGVFGGLTRTKRITSVITAFAYLRHLHPHARLLIGGRADDHAVLASVRSAVTASGMERDVRVLVEPPEEQFTEAVATADVVVNLRWPTAGETSGVMMRAFGAGKPVIASEVPQHQALPRDFCWQISVEEIAEGKSLYEHMSAAIRDPERCTQAGRAARSFVERSASWQVAADRYAEILSETVSDGATARRPPTGPGAPAADEAGGARPVV